MPLLENNAQVPNATTDESKPLEVTEAKISEIESSRKSSVQSDTTENNSENGKITAEVVNYPVETVGFPESPQPRKRLNVPENTFKDPLTNFGDEDISLDDSSSSTLNNIEPYSLERQRWLNDYSADEYFEDSLLINSTVASTHNPELNMRQWINDEESHLNNFNRTNPGNSDIQEGKYLSSLNEPVSIKANVEPLSLQLGFEPISLQSTLEPMSFQSCAEPISLQSTCSEGPDLRLLEKIKDCFDQEKIKDLYVLSGRLQDMLSPMEIEEIVMNSELYTSYIDDDMFEVFSAAHAELSSTLSRGGSVRDSRRKIKATIDHDAQEDITVKAVFQCRSNNQRNSMRLKKNLPKTDHIKKHFEDSSVKSSEKLAELEELDNKTVPLKDVIRENSEGQANTSKSQVTEESPTENALAKENCDKNQLCNNSTSSNMDNNGSANATQPLTKTSLSERPESLLVKEGNQAKRKIKVNTDILNSSSHDIDEDQRSLSSISNKSDIDVFSPVEDLATPEDIDTPEDIEDSLFDKLASTSEMIPELSAIEELQEERSWKTCLVAGVEQKIDMKVIEPYKKVLSHGGYYGPERHAIIVFSACYLPDHGRRDYDYVMDNLFFYVLTTLEQLVAEDYILVYLHGATDRNTMPTFGWLKRCYQMIDRRLRKNLKGLYLVHPTFWLKTIVIMARPFISSKFYRKLKFVTCLRDLSDLIPMDHVCIPDKVKQLEFELMISIKKKELKKRKYTSGTT